MSSSSSIKRFKKKIIKNLIVRQVLSAMASVYLTIVYNTTRWKNYNAKIMEKAWKGSEPVIVVFWHEKLLLMTNCWHSQLPFYMLVSNHADGQLVSKTIGRFGISTVFGSSSKGGGAAIKKLVRKIKSGTSIGITPDGPRGPRKTISEGALFMASLSGATIIPSSSSTKCHFTLNTWDKLVIPLPFSSGSRVWGNPITVPQKCSAEELKKLKTQLYESLNHVTKKSADLVNNTVV